MKKIRYYNDDIEKYFTDNVLSDSKKQSDLSSFGLESERKKFFVEYKKYFDKNSLEQLTQSPLTYDKNKTNTPDNYYYNLYNSKNTSKLLDELTTDQNDERESSLCPSCQIGEAEALDHYVPRSEYPYFSMNPINLIPICAKCNSKKKDRWRKNGKRLFVNFYTDSIPREQFLFVELLDVTNNKPHFNYYLEKPDNMAQDVYDLFYSHFTKLDLIKKYNKRQNSTYNDLIDEIRAGDKKAVIQEWINKEVKKYGYNNYKIILWDFCINNPIICKILNLV